MPHRWNKAAIIRRDQIESGKDITFNRVFLPYYLSVVKKIKPQSILEVGCGTGHLSLHFSRYVKIVHAIDPSIEMYKISQIVLQGADNVSLFNCSIEQYNYNIKFDLIISHLCLNSINNINVFFCAIRKYLNKDSFLFFSIPHPCFWHNYHPEWFESFNYMQKKELEVNLTITKDPKNLIKNVPYVHRPLNIYFQSLANNGLCVMNFKEILPNQNIQKLYNQSWREPRYCVFKVKILA